MTDNDIIKAFEYYFNKNDGILTVVNNGEQNIITVGDVCKVFNRQKAEIERLQGEVDMYEEERKYHFEMSRQRIAEAIKEFWSELQKTIIINNTHDGYMDFAIDWNCLVEDGNEIVKEKVGDNDV